MKLIPAEEYDVHLSTCLVSDCGKVHMGIGTVIFGYRVKAGFWEDRFVCYELEYCCGDSQASVELIYSVVKNILEQQEFSRDIFKVFPWQERKPFFTDTENWKKALALTKDIEIVKLPPVWEIRRKQLDAVFNNTDLS